MPIHRHTIRNMMIGIALLAVLLWLLMPFMQYMGRYQYIRELSRRFDSMIMPLQRRCPAGLDPAIWQESVTLTQIIGMNLYSMDNIGTEDKERLNAELAEKLKGKLGPELIPWIWSRYARMAQQNTSGGYVRSYRKLALVPLVSDSMRSRRPISIPPASWKTALDRM